MWTWESFMMQIWVIYKSHKHLCKWPLCKLGFSQRKEASMQIISGTLCHTCLCKWLILEDLVLKFEQNRFFVQMTCMWIIYMQISAQDFCSFASGHANDLYANILYANDLYANILYANLCSRFLFTAGHFVQTVPIRFL